MGLVRAGKGSSSTKPIGIKRPLFDKKGSKGAAPGKGKGVKAIGANRAIAAIGARAIGSKVTDSPLADIDNSLKVWVGGLPDGIARSRLQAHLGKAGKTTWAEILRGGSGCVAFLTSKMAANAIATLNGSKLDGYPIQVDTWGRKPKGTSKGKAPALVPKPKYSSKGKAAAPVAKGKGKTTKGKSKTSEPVKGKGKSKKGKGKGKTKGKSKSKNPLGEVDKSLKVHITNLSEDVTWQKLEEHFKQAGSAWWAQILPKGVGCVAYKNTEDVQAAIDGLDNSELEGQVITVSAWESKKELASSSGNVLRQRLKTSFLKPKLGKGKGKGKGGKGKTKANPLHKIPASQKVWIAGIPKNVTWKELEGHFNQVGKSSWSELLSKGCGCVAYKSDAEAQDAIDTLDGTDLGGRAIKVVQWQDKE